MREDFTHYLRSLDPRGEPPSPEVFGHVLEALRGVLITELKRRGLWHLPPSYVGIYGCPSWQGRDSGGFAAGIALRPQPALNELIAECYTFVFIERMESLRAQLRRKANIDGLVFLSVRNFMFERQRRHDPLGYRVFTALRSALRASVEDGDLHVLAGNPGIANDTVIAANSGADPSEAGREGAREAKLAARVESWCDDLLPELVTTRGRGHRVIQERLRGHLRRLASQDVGPFAFRSLADPFKAEVRRRWASVLKHAGDRVPIEDSDRDYSKVVAHLCPGARFEARESFESLVDCVDEAVEHTEGDARSRRYLETLWCFLITRVADSNDDPGRPAGGPPAGDPAEVPPEMDEQSLNEDLPSRRKIARLLGIPRDRLPALYEALGRMVGDCQQAVSGPIGGRTGALPEERG